MTGERRNNQVHGSKTASTISDYCILNDQEDARLSEVERLTLLGGAGLDRFLSKLGKGLSTVSLTHFAAALRDPAIRDQLDIIRELTSSGLLDTLMRCEPTPHEPSILPIHGFPYGTVFDLRFEGTFPPADLQPFDPQYATFAANQRSHVRLWEHNEQRADRLTLVAIHGWSMGDQRLNSLAFLPGLFFSLGCNVALLELPFHGRRAESDPKATFPSGNVVRTAIGVAHALHDLRQLRTFLAARGHARLGCIAVSLGAYVGALWAALERLERSVFLVPLVSMGDIAWEIMKGGSTSEELARLPLSKAEVSELFRGHSPLAFPCATDQESIMVIGGRGDHVMPRSQIGLLRAHWPHATFLWSAGGHAAPLARGKTFERMVQFLVSTPEIRT
jgi:pimeloyl-ACP methyl ester carboxylesterase